MKADIPLGWKPLNLERYDETTDPDDLSLSHMHRLAVRTIHQHAFVDHIMEADIPLGWKPLNLELYDETTNLDEHLDAFLT